jgi:23S rRNA (cytosine1962-C5)-methyltransferase
MQSLVFEARGIAGYALLDSGGGEKLERFGDVVLRRPDPQALWGRRQGPERWKGADLTFVRESDRGGRWEARPGAPAIAVGKAPRWPFDLGRARLWIRPTPFKHVGLFPEQASTWELLEKVRPSLPERPQLLNLFAYTGASSLVATSLGFAVTHVDASRAALDWARQNAELSSAPPAAIRWVLDDARAFARREAKRGTQYAGILLDPPHYGRGPKGEKWQLEEHLADLLGVCRRLLSPAAFLVLSTYAVGYSPITLANLLNDLGEGRVEAGELTLPEESLPDEGSRMLPCGQCARWYRGAIPAGLG